MSFSILSVDLPEAKNDFYANTIARKIESATGKADFDNFRYLRWSTVRDHKFVWDKTQKKVIVHFADYKVLLHLDHLDSSRIFDDGLLKANKKEAIIQKAYSHFCNDSFWLIAPYKLFDPGVERKIVVDGVDKLLLITYASGGVTPGDSYLWYLDDNYLPTSIQMWTAKVPLNGIRFSWENYKTISGEAKIAQTHRFGPLNIYIENLEAGNTMQDLKLDNNPFKSF